MTTIRSLAALGISAALGACAQSVGPAEITTGSIIPSLPAVASLVQSTGSSTAGAAPRAPERISGNLYRIDASDRRLSDPIQQQNYALLRAAHSTRQLGATHFTVVNAPPGDVRLPASADSSAMIRIFRLEPGTQPPVGAVTADEIIHFFGPTFSQPPAGAAATQGG